MGLKNNERGIRIAIDVSWSNEFPIEPAFEPHLLSFQYNENHLGAQDIPAFCHYSF
jgi:hypothetical protein